MTSYPATALTLTRLLEASYKVAFLAFALQIFCAATYAYPEITLSDDQSTMIVNDAPEQDIIAFGKSILIKKRAKSATAIGGDITVEGSVSEDVATIGGNVIQKGDAYVGGDILVVGGTYRSDGQTSLREPGKQTITIGAFEEELRDLGQNPSHIFSPTLSLGFVAQRLVVALCWFVITLLLTTLAPGAVSRAVARIQLSPLKVSALGAATFVLILSVIVFGLLALPSFLGATVGAMGMLLLILGFVFGRVALQVSVGKIIQRQFLSETSGSETLAILIGVLAWTLLLSLPYIWLIALFAVFTFGIGLVLTGRSTAKWQTP